MNDSIYPVVFFVTFVPFFKSLLFDILLKNEAGVEWFGTDC